MSKRNVKIEQYANLETGEIKPFLVIDIQEKDRDFCKVRKALSRTVVEKLNYLNGAVKLLWLIIDIAIDSKIFDKPVDIILTPELAKEKAGISSRDTFYRHIKLLLENKILIKIRPNIYRLNPEMIWLGGLKSYARWLREKQQMKIFEVQEDGKVKVVNE